MLAIIALARASQSGPAGEDRLGLVTIYLAGIGAVLQLRRKTDGCHSGGRWAETRMFDLLFDPAAWASLIALTAMEIVLGIDNIVFISVIVGKLPPEQAQARPPDRPAAGAGLPRHPPALAVLADAISRRRCSRCSASRSRGATWY